MSALEGPLALIDEETLRGLCRFFTIDPFSHAPTANYLQTQLDDCQESCEVLMKLMQILPRAFACQKGQRPSWLAAPQWAFSEGKPLVFVGQIDVGPYVPQPSRSYFIFEDEAGDSSQTICQTRT